MQRAIEHSVRGHWPECQGAGAITLDFDARHRRRFRLVSDGGEEILLDLPRAVAMADGDGLRLDDGRWLRVCAADEPVVEIRHDDPHQFARLAWHLGNRHLPTEIREHALRIRPDHVIEAMLRGFGARLTRLDAPFQPEGGAYGGHAHNHANDHYHASGEEHEHR